jgi:hypothetical protein
MLNLYISICRRFVWWIPWKKTRTKLVILSMLLVLAFRIFTCYYLTIQKSLWAHLMGHSFLGVLYMISYIIIKNIMSSIGLLILAPCIDSLYIAHWAEKRSNSNGLRTLISILFLSGILYRMDLLWSVLVLHNQVCYLPILYIRV